MVPSPCTDAATLQGKAVQTAHSRAVVRLAIHQTARDELMLISSDDVRPAIVWKIVGERLIRQPRGLRLASGGVGNIAFAGNGGMIVAGNRLRPWHVSTRRGLEPLLPLGVASTFVLHPNGKHAIVVGQDQITIGVMSIDIQDRLDEACHVANRTLTPEEWDSYKGWLGDSPSSCLRPATA